MPPVERPINHGTRSAYTRRKCRCQLCRDAEAAYQREWTQRNRERRNAISAASYRKRTGGGG